MRFLCIFFDRLNKLERLWLYENKIAIIKNNKFKHLKKLMELDLQFNSITQIKSGSFEHLKNLLHLNLSHNALQCFNFKLVSSKLKELNIAENNLIDYNQIIIELIFK